MKITNISNEISTFACVLVPDKKEMYYRGIKFIAKISHIFSRYPELKLLNFSDNRKVF